MPRQKQEYKEIEVKLNRWDKNKKYYCPNCKREILYPDYKCEFCKIQVIFSVDL